MLSKLLPTLRSALVCTLSLLATASLAQTTIHVGPGQTYPTIQSGIDAANTGDTVLVAPGTYNENIDFKGKAITVTSSGGASQTIIDGGQKAPAVVFITSETRASVLSGFTIQNGGILDSTVFINGGIYLYHSSPTILLNTLTQNNCWTIYSLYSAPLIQGNGIYATQDPKGNCSFNGGAGIRIDGNLNGSSVTDGSTSAIIFDNLIANNVESGLDDGGGNGGAGIAVLGGSPIVLYNVIRNNASPGGSGGAINVVLGTNIAIVQNLIYGNSAGCGGGALAIDALPDSSTGISALIANNTIVDNVSLKNAGTSECPAIAQIYPSPVIYGATAVAMIFINNIISGSTPYPAVNCSSFGPPNEADQPTFKNNILYNAGGPFFGSSCADVSGKYNNIAADPQLVDPSGDFHLKSASPAIDSGDNSVVQTFMTMTGMDLSKDSGGNPRLQDATGKGCIIDMGAYEYTGTVSDCGGISETLTSSINPARAGQSVTFTAQLTAQSGTPTGAIQFLDATNLLSTQTVSSTGSASFTTNVLTVGSHTITANYQPTGAFGSSTASITQVITGDTTSTALTCQPNPITIGNTAQLSAIVTSPNGTPTGSIAFTDNGTALATQALLSGATSLTYTGSIAGTHTVTATYTPTGPFAASSATCSEVVDALPTISNLSVSNGTPIYGTSFQLNASVTANPPPGPSIPTGTVTFLNGASTLGTASLSAGTATLPVGGLHAGKYNLSCSYGGSSIYASSTCAPVSVTVFPDATNLRLTSSANPAPYPGPVTFTATLIPLNGQPIGAGYAILLTAAGQTVTLTTASNGSATYTFSNLAAGVYPVTAHFAGNSNLLASSASLTEVITAAPTSVSLTGTPNPGDLNQLITMTAAVSTQTNSTKVGEGNVTFYDGANALGSSPLSAAGTTSKTASFSTLGVHSITAVYDGDANFSSSTSPVLKETIIAGDFSIAVNPAALSLYTGQAAAAKISITSLNGFNQPLALSCIGLPANATCSFTPASLPNGQGDANLVIQTAAPHKAVAGSASGSAALLGALTLLLLPRRKLRRRFLAGLSVFVLAVVTSMGMAGCGSPHAITGGTPPGAYQVAVTATAGGDSTALTHSAVVTLTVKSLF